MNAPNDPGHRPGEPDRSPEGAGGFEGHTGRPPEVDPSDWEVEVDLQALDEELSDMAAHIEATVAAVAEQVTGSLRGAGLSDEEAARVAERLRRAQERTIRTAQHKLEHARRKAERHARRAEERARRMEGRAQRRAEHGQSWSWQWQGGVGRGGPGRPAARPASDDERLAVLKMLSEGRVSADEASRLLAALEGR